jgi:ABC-type branched-subunit amino acid transport system substrate-binding protein
MQQAQKDAILAHFFQDDADTIVKLDYKEDPDSPEAASEMARTLRNNPSVLAVVGHSKSGTTLAALPFYSQAGIPVLMPAATSPYVLYGFERNHPRPNAEQLMTKSTPLFKNAFRLPPSDVPDQVVAIRLLVDKLNEEKKAGAKRNGTETKGTPAGQLDGPNTGRGLIKVMVICDVTRRTGADVYTVPMCQALREDPKFSRYLQHGEYRELELDTGDVYGVVTQIHAVKPEVLVLMAYPDLVAELLQELRERAEAMPGGSKDSPQQMKDYKIIVSDASFPNIQELAGFGAPIYLTSMTSPRTCDVHDYKDLVKANDERRRTEKPSGEPTSPDQISVSEGYTFDALYVLSRAIEQCGRDVDRGCVMQILKYAQPLQGICQDYTLINGERRNAEYYVYSACKDKMGRIQAGAQWSVTPDKKALDEHADWCPKSN